MKLSKKMIIGCSLALGIAAGSILFSPKGISATNNIILASVEWVNSQLNPINTKINKLEQQLAAQQQEINQLKAIIEEGGITIPTPAPGVENPPVTQIPETIYTAKNNVTVHSGATRDYKVVSTLSNKGRSLKVIDSFTSATGLWYRVELSSTLKGWVFSGDVSIEKTAPTNISKVVTTGSVHLRKGATTAYGIIETLKKGTTLTYIQSFTNAYGETWYNVETPQGKRGWIISTLGEVK